MKQVPYLRLVKTENSTSEQGQNNSAQSLPSLMAWNTLKGKNRLIRQEQDLRAACRAATNRAITMINNRELASNRCFVAPSTFLLPIPEFGDQVVMGVYPFDLNDEHADVSEIIEGLHSIPYLPSNSAIGIEREEVITLLKVLTDYYNDLTSVDGPNHKRSVSDYEMAIKTLDKINFVPALENNGRPYSYTLQVQKVPSTEYLFKIPSAKLSSVRTPTGEREKVLKRAFVNDRLVNKFKDHLINQLADAHWGKNKGLESIIMKYNAEINQSLSDNQFPDKQNNGDDGLTSSVEFNKWQGEIMAINNPAPPTFSAFQYNKASQPVSSPALEKNPLQAHKEAMYVVNLMQRVALIKNQIDTHRLGRLESVKMEAYLLEKDNFKAAQQINLMMKGLSLDIIELQNLATSLKEIREAIRILKLDEATIQSIFINVLGDSALIFTSMITRHLANQILMETPGYQTN